MSLAADHLTDWIRTTDVHAAHRIAVLQRAQRVLAGVEPASGSQRAHLATALERWRYQHLNACRGRYDLLDRQLLDRLDALAGAVAGYPARPARNPRAAVFIGDCGDCPDFRAAKVGLSPLPLGEPPAPAVSELLAPTYPLDELIARAAAITRANFSLPPAEDANPARRRMLLYAPIYLSSYCTNHCVYCGFRHSEPIPRRHLTSDEAMREADVLLGRGFRHILLVAGDFPSLTSTEYCGEIIGRLAARGAKIAVEIAPQSTQSYAALVHAGTVGVTLYQETYQQDLYAHYHPRGSKGSFDWRLEALERAAEAGMRRLGLGVLLGLADPHDDLPALLRHAMYLAARFPRCRLAISLPRIHGAPSDFKIGYPVDDDTFVRLYCAARIALPQAELVLSTREPPDLRARLAGICITQMSAGSSTVPGGYADCTIAESDGGQFPVYDHRSPAEVTAWLDQAGITPLWTLPE